MWTAQILEVLKDQNPQAHVLFTDGIKYKKDEWFSLQGITADSFRERVETRRKFYEDSFVFADTVDTDFLNTVSTPTTTPPTKEQVDLGTFTTDYQAWLAVKRGIDVGVLTGQEDFVKSLLAKVQSEFKVEYISLL